MFVRGDFSNYIDAFTLRFKKSTLEAHYVQSKDEQLNYTTYKRILMGSAAFFAFGFFLIAKKHYEENNNWLAVCAILSVVIGNLGIGLEIFLHKFSSLRNLRGLFVSIGAFFSCSFYATRVLSSPSFLPG